MQALILCRGNIGGIRSNPEGYGGAYPAPRQCKPCSWCILPSCFSLPKDLFRGCANVTEAINTRLINTAERDCLSRESNWNLGS
jgi:hypothetical protein